MGRIVIIGSANIDYVVTLERLPAPGETVTGGVFDQIPGGKGANQAVAAARAAHEKEIAVSFIGCVGDDPFTKAMVDGYKTAGLETSRIRVDSNAATGAALITVDANAENTIAAAPGANRSLIPAWINEDTDLIKSADLLLLQNELRSETVVRALEVANEAGVPAIFNFAPIGEIPAAALPMVHTLVVNEVEAEFVSGSRVDGVDAAFAAAETIAERGVAQVLVTLGDQGVVAAGEERFHVPAFSVTARDTTAAGDTFCGAFAVARTEGESLENAVRFAGAAAAISVQRAGAQPSIPIRDEIEAFLQER